MANVETFQSIPDAVRSLNGFSHIGYTPQTAIADIIDNSISAKATKIHVQIIPRMEGTVVYIADNGTGMSRERLKEAMRFGSSTDLKNSELSVYGLGFKLASLSFAPRFTMITRDEKGDVNAATWDKADQAKHQWQVSVTDEPARGSSRCIVVQHRRGASTWCKQFWRRIWISQPRGSAAFGSG